MSILDYFPSKYYRGEDVTTPLQLTVAGLTQEIIGEEKRLKVVVSFTEGTKQLVVNKTNALELDRILGTNEKTWAGKKIELYAAHVMFQGKRTIAVRVRPPSTLTLQATRDASFDEDDDSTPDTEVN